MKMKHVTENDIQLFKRYQELLTIPFYGMNDSEHFEEQDLARRISGSPSLKKKYNEYTTYLSTLNKKQKRDDKDVLYEHAREERQQPMIVEKLSNLPTEPEPIIINEPVVEPFNLPTTQVQVEVEPIIEPFNLPTIQVVGVEDVSKDVDDGTLNFKQLKELSDRISELKQMLERAKRRKIQYDQLKIEEAELLEQLKQYENYL